jgi:hypothetical protein
MCHCTGYGLEPIAPDCEEDRTVAGRGLGWAHVEVCDPALVCRVGAVEVHRGAVAGHPPALARRDLSGRIAAWLNQEPASMRGAVPGARAPQSLQVAGVPWTGSWTAAALRCSTTSSMSGRSGSRSGKCTASSQHGSQATVRKGTGRSRAPSLDPQAMHAAPPIRSTLRVPAPGSPYRDSVARTRPDSGQRADHHPHGRAAPAASPRHDDAHHIQHQERSCRSLIPDRSGRR